MTNIQNIQADFVNSWQRLQQRWQETRAVWRDTVHDQFERDCWQPLETEMRATQRELERLDDVIISIMRNEK